MYFPYLRGKQFELIAIRDFAEWADNKEIIPIIEPVKASMNTLFTAGDKLTDQKFKFLIILNPEYGENKNNHARNIDDIQEKYHSNQFCVYTYILNQETACNDLKKFINLSRGHAISLIYKRKPTEEEATYINSLNNINYSIFDEKALGRHTCQKLVNIFQEKSEPIILEDNFKKEEKNADYQSEDVFSDRHILYKTDGYAGFSDYLIVGDHFSEVGGPAFAVTIHLSYIDEKDDSVLKIRHYVSDQTETREDTAGKFEEALQKLIKDIKSDPQNENFNTRACNTFNELYNAQHFPGLGFVKKLSMLQHIEILNKYLKRAVK